jgi:S13-like protein
LSAASTRLLDQRLIALRRANEIRSRRANLKQQLRAGRVPLEEILAAPPDYLATADVFDLLVAVPKIGPVKAARLLTSARVSQSKTVGWLSERQRGRLIELLSRQHRETI